MRPTAARSNRSSVHHPRSSPIPSPATTSVYHQPQQQQILYAPISNPMVTLQPCGTVLHPSCVYPNVQSHVGSSNSAALHLQGLKKKLISINIIRSMFLFSVLNSFSNPFCKTVFHVIKMVLNKL